MSEAKTLYIRRDVLNAPAIIKHFKDQGFGAMISPSDMHVTQAYSRQKLSWNEIPPALYQDEAGQFVVSPNPSGRFVEPLGDKGAVVLKFYSPELQARFKEIIRAGASWDYPSYQSHVTLTYNGSELDLTKIEPYTGKIVLGPEVFEELNEDWSAGVEESISNN